MQGEKARLNELNSVLILPGPWVVTDFALFVGLFVALLALCPHLLFLLDSGEKRELPTS